MRLIYNIMADNFNLCTKKESVEAQGITCPDCMFVYDLIVNTHHCNDPPCGLDKMTAYSERPAATASKLVARCFKCEKIKARPTKHRLGTCPECNYTGHYIYSDNDKRCSACINAQNVPVVIKAQRVKDSVTSEISINEGGVTCTIIETRIKTPLKVCFEFLGDKIQITTYTKESVATDQLYLTSNICSAAQLSDLLHDLSRLYEITWVTNDFSQCIMVQKWYSEYIDEKKYSINLVNW